MYIFYLNIVRNVKINMSKVPNSLNSALNKLVSHRNSLFLGNCQNSDLYAVLFDKCLHLIHRPYFYVPYLSAVKIRITVKCSLKYKASSGKIGVTGNCRAKVSCTYNNQ